MADTKVTEAGLKPVSETAGAVGVTDGAAVALVGVVVGAAEAATDPPAEAAADVAAGAAGDETAGALDATAVLAAALPAAVE